MKVLSYLPAIIAVATLTACGGTGATEFTAASSDACGVSQYQSLVGGPSSATMGLDIPDNSRHYGSEERVATNDPSRLNFGHSGTAIESVTDPASTVVRVFCG